MIHHYMTTATPGTWKTLELPAQSHGQLLQVQLHIVGGFVDFTLPTDLWGPSSMEAFMVRLDGLDVFHGVPRVDCVYNPGTAKEQITGNSFASCVIDLEDVLLEKLRSAEVYLPGAFFFQPGSVQAWAVAVVRPGIRRP